MRKQIYQTLSTLILAGVLAGCGNLPGTGRQQGAVIGGAGGAATGAVLAGENNRLLGALIGGALGAGGGYLIGARSDRINDHDRSAAEQASRAAETTPATANAARAATTADINNDGFVTMDEVVALKDAGLSDDQMIERLSATGQVFELTSSQRDFLRDRGLSTRVINQMEQLNREQRDRLLGGQSGVVGRPRY